MGEWCPCFKANLQFYKKTKVYCRHVTWHAVWHRPEGFPKLIPILTRPCHLAKKKKQSFLISVNPCVNIRFCSCLHARQVLLVQHSGHAPHQDFLFPLCWLRGAHKPVSHHLQSDQLGEQVSGISSTSFSHFQYGFWWLPMAVSVKCVQYSDALSMKWEFLWLEVSGGGLALRRKAACSQKKMV